MKLCLIFAAVLLSSVSAKVLPLSEEDKSNTKKTADQKPAPVEAQSKEAPPSMVMVDTDGVFKVPLTQSSQLSKISASKEKRQIMKTMTIQDTKVQVEEVRDEMDRKAKRDAKKMTNEMDKQKPEEMKNHKQKREVMTMDKDSSMKSTTEGPKGKRAVKETGKKMESQKTEAMKEQMNTKQKREAVFTGSQSEKQETMMGTKGEMARNDKSERTIRNNQEYMKTSEVMSMEKDRTMKQRRDVMEMSKKMASDEETSRRSEKMKDQMNRKQKRDTLSMKDSILDQQNTKQSREVKEMSSEMTKPKDESLQQAGMMSTDRMRKRNVMSIASTTTTDPVEDTSNNNRCDILCTKLELNPICAVSASCVHEFPNQCVMETYNCLHPEKAFKAVKDGICQMQWSNRCRDEDLRL